MIEVMLDSERNTTKRRKERARKGRKMNDVKGERRPERRPGLGWEMSETACQLGWTMVETDCQSVDCWTSTKTCPKRNRCSPNGKLRIIVLTNICHGTRRRIFVARGMFWR